MEPELKTITQKMLVGKKLPMSLKDNRTPELWKTFMPRRHEIHERISSDLFSLQVYPPGYYERFDPANFFEKWATAEVGSTEHIPEGMEVFVLPAGQYAVFSYKGLSTDTRIFQYIFTEWLPRSLYVLDERPHFEILGEKYRHGDPDSEEEIWIPVKAKQ